MTQTTEGISGPVGRPAPRRAEARTWSFRVADAKGYLTVSGHPDGSVASIALRMAKQGSTLAGMTDALSGAVSVGLQHGAPLHAYVGQYAGMRFAPAGRTDDDELPVAASVMDYIARRIALDWPLSDDLSSGPAQASALLVARPSMTPAEAPTSGTDEPHRRASLPAPRAHGDREVRW